LPCHNAIVDDEAVVLDANCRASFSRFRPTPSAAARAPCSTPSIFLDGRDTAVDGRIEMDDPSAALAACETGQGLFQSFEVGLTEWLASGKLLPVCPNGLTSVSPYMPIILASAAASRATRRSRIHSPSLICPMGRRSSATVEADPVEPERQVAARARLF
jgi:hypothetical protein